MLKLPVVILCGGLATRLRPITEKIPKNLIEIDGVPFIHHQLKFLQTQGFKDVYLCVGFLGEMIEDFVKDGSSYNLNVKYVFDGEQLLGTGGAIKKLLSTYPLEEFFVLYGDSYLTCDFQDIENSYERNERSPVMIVYQNNDKFEKSNVKFDGESVIYYNKNCERQDLDYIDYGSILRLKDFENTQSSFDLSVIHKNLVENNALNGHEVHERFYEVGSTKGIEELNNYLKSKT
jgi:NDP-sugar pyrophosphorylase family protein